MVKRVPYDCNMSKLVFKTHRCSTFYYTKSQLCQVIKPIQNQKQNIDVSPEVLHNQLSTKQAQQSEPNQIDLKPQEQQHQEQQAWPIDNARSQSCKVCQNKTGV
jgi:hypothetical protein